MKKYIQIKCPHCGHKIDILLNDIPVCNEDFFIEKKQDISIIPESELNDLAEKFGIYLGVSYEGGENENG